VSSLRFNFTLLLQFTELKSESQLHPTDGTFLRGVTMVSNTFDNYFNSLDNVKLDTRQESERHDLPIDILNNVCEAVPKRQLSVDAHRL
jgi:hypothetical protein